MYYLLHSLNSIQRIVSFSRCGKASRLSIKFQTFSKQNLVSVFTRKPDKNSFPNKSYKSLKLQWKIQWRNGDDRSCVLVLTISFPRQLTIPKSLFVFLTSEDRNSQRKGWRRGWKRRGEPKALRKWRYLRSCIRRIQSCEGGNGRICE